MRKNKVITFPNLIYTVIIVSFLFFVTRNYIDNKRSVKRSIEMHKLNIEKVKLEIKILKQKNDE